MSNYVTIKIPRWAADLALELQTELGQRGRQLLPEHVRDELMRRGHNGPTLGKGTTVAAALLIMKRHFG